MKNDIESLLVESAKIPLLVLVSCALVHIIALFLGQEMHVGLGIILLLVTWQWGFLMIVFSVAYCVSARSEQEYAENPSDHSILGPDNGKEK